MKAMVWSFVFFLLAFVYYALADSGYELSPLPIADDAVCANLCMESGQWEIRDVSMPVQDGKSLYNQGFNDAIDCLRGVQGTGTFEEMSEVCKKARNVK